MNPERYLQQLRMFVASRSVHLIPGSRNATPRPLAPHPSRGGGWTKRQAASIKAHRLLISRALFHIGRPLMKIEVSGSPREPDGGRGRRGGGGGEGAGGAFVAALNSLCLFYEAVTPRVLFLSCRRCREQLFPEFTNCYRSISSCLPSPLSPFFLFSLPPSSAPLRPLSFRCGRYPRIWRINPARGTDTPRR